MPRYTQSKQILVAEEVTTGSLPPSFVSTGNVITVIDPQFTPDISKIARLVATPTFTKRPPAAGLQLGQITFQMELAGPSDGSLTTEPDFGICLQACGFLQRQIRSVAMASVGDTGLKYFKTGSTLNDGSNNFGVAVGSLHTKNNSVSAFDGDDNRLRYYLNPGESDPADLATITITGSFASTGAVAADADESDAGFGWIPQSRPYVKMDVEATNSTNSSDVNVGDVIQGNTSGAVGIVVEALGDVGASTGSLKFRPIHGTFQDGETILNATTTMANTLDTAATVNITQEAYKSISIGINEDGVLKTLRGCRGEVQVAHQAGQPVFLTFTFTGIYNQPADVAPFLGLSETQATAPRYVGVNAMFRDGWDSAAQFMFPTWSQFNWGTANSIGNREDASDSSGLREIIGGDRELSGSMDPEALLEIVFGAEQKARSQTTFRMRMDWGTTGSNNAFLFKADNVVFDVLGSGDRGGILTHDASNIRFYGDSDEDELVLISQ